MKKKKKIVITDKQVPGPIYFQYYQCSENHFASYTESPRISSQQNWKLVFNLVLSPNPVFHEKWFALQRAQDNNSFGGNLILFLACYYRYKLP